MRHAAPIGATVVVAGLALAWWTLRAPTQGAPPSLSTASTTASTAAAPADAPNVLMIVWDTVRADRLSLYGHDAPTTPWLDRFSRDATVYERAISPSFWTLPSHASLFTGLPTTTHRAILRKDPWLDGQLVTLAEHLGAQGWETYAWTSNPYVYTTSNVLQGFQTVDDPLLHERWRDLAVQTTVDCLHPEDRSSLASPKHPKRIAPPTKNAGKAAHTALIDWLETRRDDERPFFAFLNYMEAHTPRTPCPESRAAIFGDDAELQQIALETIADTKRLHRAILQRGRGLGGRQLEAIAAVYDASIRDLDTRTGALMDDLAARGLLDDTLVILTSDHGEQLGEHGLFNHNFSIYQALVHVPLVLRLPGTFDGARVGTTVSTMALYPTVLDLLSLPAPHDELLPSLRDDAPDLAFTELLMPHSYAPGRERLNRSYRAVVAGPHKLILANDGQRELYELDTDPMESTDLAAEQPVRREELVQQIEAWADAAPVIEPGPRPEVPSRKELRAQLEALGYVQ